MENKKILGQIEDIISVIDSTYEINFSLIYLFNAQLSDEEDEKPNDFLFLSNENKEPIALMEIYNEPNSFIIRRMLAASLKFWYYVVLKIEKEKKFYYVFSKKDGYVSKVFKIEIPFIISELGVEFEFSKLKFE